MSRRPPPITEEPAPGPGPAGLSRASQQPRFAELRGSRLRPRLIVGLAVAVFTCHLTGCGRPATPEECEEIVARIAELELREAPALSPEEREAQVEATKAAFRERAMEECVGKRLTEGALKCLREATTAKAIIEDCFP